MTEERLARRTKRLEKEKFFDKSTGEETFGVEGARSEIQLFMKPSQWGGTKLGKEFCGLADAEGKTR